tara:strand:- start:41 stop:313 length:273 start_codon:yes stop_codon:yes gene_type:complete
MKRVFSEFDTYAKRDALDRLEIRALDAQQTLILERIVQSDQTLDSIETKTADTENTLIELQDEIKDLHAVIEEMHATLLRLVDYHIKENI